MPKAPKPQRTNVVKRACDACKVRKIKCSETSPCHGCVGSGIACTFRTNQATRGPRSLRAKTIQKITKTQGDGGHAGHHGRGAEAGAGPLPAALSPSLAGAAALSPRSLAREEDTRALIQALEIYRRRLYPIWPIVAVDELEAQLSSTQDEGHPRARLLATAVRLATTAQLRLEAVPPDEVPRTSLEDGDDAHDLTSLRLAFFLHIYHENQSAGGGKSLLYLRQAVTIAQVLRLDREASYAGLPRPEQQMRRRVLWLLFVTERGVAMLHRLPAVLRPNILFPYPDGAADDREHVLPAFLKLTNLFWIFEQSGIFEILQNSDSDLSNMAAAARGCLDLLQQRLEQDSGAADEYDGDPAHDDDDGDGAAGASDVQKADLYVTRQWMRTVLWRAAASFGLTSLASSPVRIAREFLAFVSQLPQAAMEAHGPTIEFKTYDIATAVIDAVTSASSQSQSHSQQLNPSADHPEEVLQGLQRLLSSSRGGNKALLASLYLKMAAVVPSPSPPCLQLSPLGRLSSSSPSPGQVFDGGGRPSSSPNDSNNNNNAQFLPSAWADLEEILGHAATNSIILRAASSGHDGGDGNGSGSPDYHSLEQQNLQMSWPPLDFGTPLIRTPSPLLLGRGVGAGAGGLDLVDQAQGEGEGAEFLQRAWDGATP